MRETAGHSCSAKPCAEGCGPNRLRGQTSPAISCESGEAEEVPTELENVFLKLYAIPSTVAALGSRVLPRGAMLTGGFGDCDGISDFSSRLTEFKGVQICMFGGTS